MSEVTTGLVELATMDLPSLSLGVVIALADMQTRTDRKYLVAPEVVTALTDELGDVLAALEIDGMRSFAYESLYFDTPELDAYHGAALGRRRRYKVRTRSYLDSGDCAFEVKTRGGREETIKHRMPYDIDDRGRLTPDALAFVAEHVDQPVGDRLAATLVTSYRRTTLVDLTAGTRLTCDAGLVCTAADGSSVALPGHVLVETKSFGPATAADRLLWGNGYRPLAVSKFCMGMAALRPGLRANRWNRPLRQYFGWTPSPVGP